MARTDFPPGYKPRVGDTLILCSPVRYSRTETKLLPARVTSVRRKYFDTESTFSSGGAGSSWVRTLTWRLDTFRGVENTAGTLFPDEAAYRKHVEDVRVVGKAGRIIHQWQWKSPTPEQARALIAIFEPESTAPAKP